MAPTIKLNPTHTAETNRHWVQSKLLMGNLLISCCLQRITLILSLFPRLQNTIQTQLLFCTYLIGCFDKYQPNKLHNACTNFRVQYSLLNWQVGPVRRLSIVLNVINIVCFLQDDQLTTSSVKNLNLNWKKTKSQVPTSKLKGTRQPVWTLVSGWAKLGWVVSLGWLWCESTKYKLKLASKDD